jgi:succinate dehydrogenase/fumarate reductase flavoprotein subunit
VTDERTDVLVIGGGLAGLSAALAARESGASVRLIERAPKNERGGNTRFANGALRASYRGIDDIRRLLPDLTPEQIAQTDFGTYAPERYLGDMARVTEGRSDPTLSRIMVDESYDVLCWLMSCGAPGTSVRAGIWPPYAGRGSIPATGCGWRWRPARSPTDSGRGATRPAGPAMRRRTAM